MAESPQPEEVTSGVSFRELDARMEEMRRAVDIALASSGSKVELREYLEALRSSDQRALDMASEERAKAAEALRDEQRRALNVAQEEREKAAKALSAGTDRAIADNFARLSDRLDAYEEHIAQLLGEKDRATTLAADEREKAADALRIGLDRAIKEGDDRLREHISNQVQQIREGIASADKLELARIEAVRTQLSDSMLAAAAAVTKAEASVERRLEGMNEFRGQLSDQAASFMRSEVADAQFNELRRAIADLSDKVNRLA